MPCAGSRWPDGVPDLTFQHLQLLGNVGGNPSPLAAVDFGLLHPVKQRMRRAADLGRYRCHRCPARGMLAFVIQDHPYRSGTDLGGELVRRVACHGSILFGSWSLRQSRSGSRTGDPAVGEFDEPNSSRLSARFLPEVRTNKGNSGYWPMVPSPGGTANSRSAQGAAIVDMELDVS